MGEMHKVTKRVFGTDAQGRRYLVAAAGQSIPKTQARELGLIEEKAQKKADTEDKARHAPSSKGSS